MEPDPTLGLAFEHNAVNFRLQVELSFLPATAWIATDACYFYKSEDVDLETMPAGALVCLYLFGDDFKQLDDSMVEVEALAKSLGGKILEDPQQTNMGYYLVDVSDPLDYGFITEIEELVNGSQEIYNAGFQVKLIITFDNPYNPL